jgi:hypothetical protein
VNSNSTPPEGLSGRVTASSVEFKDRCPGVAIGPQVGAHGFEGVEVHYWDAEKAAEVARLLAEHPPRDYTITTTSGRTGQPKETP